MPDKLPYQSPLIPSHLEKALKRHTNKLTYRLMEHIDAGILKRNVDNSEFLDYVLQIAYNRLVDFGVDTEDDIYKILVGYIERILLKLREEDWTEKLDYKQVMVLDYLDYCKIDQEIDPEGGISFDREYYQYDNEFLYAIDNHLCYHLNGLWHLTELGKTLISLPEIQATRLLLTIESFLHTGKVDEFHIPERFLELILKHVEWSNNTLFVEGNRFLGTEYSERLFQFGLAESDSSKTSWRLNPLGKSIIESILAKDSVFDIIVPIYFREEIVGTKSPQFNSAEDFERFRKVLENSPIIGDLKDTIFEEINRLSMINAICFSIFKSLAPCIEGILRNICEKEGLKKAEGTGMGAYIKTIKMATKPLLKNGTLEMLDGIFRSFRNTVEHGNVIPPEAARILCDLCLWVIEYIHRDYLELSESSSQ
ncbi:MAG: hypothetical protein MUO64_11060 [Anaerolineales bacterium]|nr:hypothetical protein [Anaerolineales bacterium]